MPTRALSTLLCALLACCGPAEVTLESSRAERAPGDDGVVATGDGDDAPTDADTSDASSPSDEAPTAGADAEAEDGEGDGEVAGGDTGTAPATSAPTHGSGGSTGVQGGAYAGRDYLLYVPASYDAAVPTPLVVAMHGLGDTFANFFQIATYYGWQAAAEAAGFIVMVPAHQNLTRASFLHFDASGLFDAQATADELFGVLETAYYGVGAAYNIETAAIYYVGFSEGGTSADLAAYWLYEEVRAAAPYAGSVGGKGGLPRSRLVPVYAVAGSEDFAFDQIVSAHAEWQRAGSPTNEAWVGGVGHQFSALCTLGPSPESVYRWMSSAPTTPVSSKL